MSVKMEVEHGEKQVKEGSGRGSERGNLSWRVSDGVQRVGGAALIAAAFVRFSGWPLAGPTDSASLFCTVTSACRRTARYLWAKTSTSLRKLHIYSHTYTHTHTCTWGQMSSLEQWDPVYSLCSLGHTATSIQGKPITVCVCVFVCVVMACSCSLFLLLSPSSSRFAFLLCPPSLHLALSLYLEKNECLFL